MTLVGGVRAEGMGLAYLFILAVALGVLVLQIALSSHGGGHHGDISHDAHSADGDAGGLWPLFLSVRFWLFAALGFGLSGSLLHLLKAATPTVTVLLSSASGLTSGLFAALVVRAMSRGAVATEAQASQAVGRTGRVIILGKPPALPGRQPKFDISGSLKAEPPS